MNKRVLTIIMIGLSCVGVSYVAFSSPKKGVQEQKILKLIEEGNAASAEAVFHKVCPKKLPYPLSFYKGLIAQSRGKFAESHPFYQTALKNPKLEKEALFLDIFFAEMANAFFEQKELTTLLSSAHRICESHPLFAFFDGLSFYMQGNYKESLNCFEMFEKEEKQDLGKWGSSLFNHLFPKSLRQLYLAHCLIESKEILKGREIVEKENRINKSDDFHEFVTLFLGLSYLKEAEAIPLEQRGSYYQMSQFYFEKSTKKFTPERKRLASHIQNEVESLLNYSETEKKWALGFVQILQLWKDDAALLHLSQVMTDLILSKKDFLLCDLCAEKFSHGGFHNLLRETLIASLSEKLKNSNDLTETWEIAEALSGFDQEIAKKVAVLTREQIFDAINQDDKTLILTRQYIRFWEKFNPAPQEKYQFARTLLNFSTLLWHTEGQEHKGLSLMDIALELNGEIQESIETFLTNLYFEAENSNMIRRLAFIYEALEYLGISRQELATPCKIANYLADAEYLYNSRNFFSAKIQAGWVLKLDPLNESALRLVGLSSFHLGEYTQATYALNQLSDPDEYASKALILSQVYSSESSEKHLVRIDNSDTFDADE